MIRPDNTATFFVGKTDLGQGTGTAFRQIMSDELDIAFENTTCVMGSTDVTVDQGGSGGSDALQTDGYPMRRVAAEARRVLLEMAPTHFGVPVTRSRSATAWSRTKNGDTADRSITYGELIGGKKFNVTLTGRNIDATTGVAPLKPVQAMKNVGKSPRRDDIPAKVNGSQRWAVDMKVPGMVHARNVRPPVVGATLKAIDESSVKDVPGFVKVVSRGNYVAVVCEREEKAIRAARQLKVEWTPPAAAPFPGVGRSLHLHAIDDALVRRATRRSSAIRLAAIAGARPPSSRRTTTCRSRDTPRSVPRTRSPIRRTGSSRSIRTT